MHSTAGERLDYDVLVVGSGFGGSVTALRLTEKGYRVGVLEAGARFDGPGLRDELLGPQALPLPARGRLLRHPAHRRAQGLPDRLRRGRRRRVAGLRQHALRAAAGVLHRPAVEPHHRLAGRARAVLRPGEADAGRGREPAAHARRRRHGAGRRPRWASPTPSTRPRSASSSAARATAGGTEVADPFFGGAGPRRTTCIGCGECMSGCRHNAKNTLVKNYLYLAEQNGATVLPLTTVTRLAPRAEEHGGGWDVHVRFTKARTGRASATRVLRAEQVVRRGLLAGHPAAAAPDARRGPPAPAVAPAWATCPAPTRSRSWAPSPRT